MVATGIACSLAKYSIAKTKIAPLLEWQRLPPSAHHKSAACGDHADRREHKSEVPVGALVREQGDGGDDQRDLQKYLAQVEAIGAAAGVSHFCLQSARFILDVLLLVAILVDLFVEVFQIGRAHV